MPALHLPCGLLHSLHGFYTCLHALSLLRSWLFSVVSLPPLYRVMDVCLDEYGEGGGAERPH